MLGSSPRRVSMLLNLIADSKPISGIKITGGRNKSWR